MRIVGILLAAGAGTRFGGGKLMAKLDDGMPMGARSCATLVAALGEVIAVVVSRHSKAEAISFAIPANVLRRFVERSLR